MPQALYWVEYKRCAKCGVNVRAPRRSQCRECLTARRKAYRQSHAEQERATRSAHRLANAETIKAYRRAYNAEHRQERTDKRREYNRAHPEKINASNRAYRRRDPERYAAIDKAAKERQRAANPEGFRAKEAAKMARRRREDPQFLIHGRVAAHIYLSLKKEKAGRKWESLVGYSLAELIAHLQNTVPAGYEWQDYIDGKLELDHIIPVSAHRFTGPDDPDFRRCWALSNLRLLPAEENKRKAAKIIQAFQPSLL